MKRIIALLLTLILVISLCACSNEKLHSNEEAGNTLSKEDEKYVGTTWECNLEESPHYYYRDMYSFRLLPNGKAIWKEGDYNSDVHTLIIDADMVYAGEWTLDEDRIIIFTSPFNGETEAMILNIVSNEKLSYSGNIYTKVN